MPLIKEIIAALEEFAPRTLQEEYDNAGIQIGDPEIEATGAILCVDVTEKIVAEAIANGSNLIISHHPLLFHGVKSITPATETGRIIFEAIKNGITIYSAHTNFDNVHGGVSFEMATRLGLKNVKTLDPHPLVEPGYGVISLENADKFTGCGVIGTIPATDVHDFLEKVKKVFSVGAVRYSTGASKEIRKVALCGGSGAFLIKKAIENGADVYVTGDVKYHDFTTYGNDIILADIGHFESEQFTKQIFYNIISKKFPNFAIYYPSGVENPINYL